VRVLFAYKYLTLGGVETILRARMAGLAHLGIEAHAWFLEEGPGRSLFHEMPERIHVGGLPDLHRYLEGQPPDVLTVIDSEDVLDVAEDLSRPVRVVIECHSPYPENRIYLRWARRQRVAAIFVPSLHQARTVASWAGKIAPTRVIPNPLAEYFCQPLSEKEPRPTAPILLWIGRLDFLKNWTAYLKTCRRVVQGLPNVEIWLVGQASIREAQGMLLRRGRQAGILHRLRWFRGVPHQRLPAFMDAVRMSGGLVLSTSRAEAFGMTIAEAMARECAVLAPNEGPFQEYVRPGISGFLYTPGSAEDAARKAIRAIEDHELRQEVGRRARQDILASYSPERALGVLADELRSVAQSV